MKYGESDWAKCRWKLAELPVDILSYEKYPELGEIFKPIIASYQDEFPSIDTLIRYIVLVYHRNSPYAKNEGNIIKRKIDVCELLGLDIEKSEIKLMIANQTNSSVVAIIHFLKQENSLDWFELQVLTETYYQTMFTLLDDSDVGKKTGIEIAEKKNKVVQQFKTTKTDIQMLSDKIFSNDTDLLNMVERYKKAEEENFLILSPEDYVRSKRVVE